MSEHRPYSLIARIAPEQQEAYLAQRGRLEPGNMTDGEIASEMARLLQEVEKAAAELNADAEFGSTRGEQWRIRASSRVAHLRRQMAALLREQNSRKPAPKKTPHQPTPSKAELSKSANLERQMEAMRRRDESKIAYTAAVKQNAILKDARLRSFDRCFFKAAKELLPVEQFNAVLARAKELELERE